MEAIKVIEGGFEGKIAFRALQSLLEIGGSGAEDAVFLSDQGETDGGGQAPLSGTGREEAEHAGTLLETFESGRKWVDPRLGAGSHMVEL